MDKADIKVQAGTRGIRVSPTLYGLFFEDINHSADGGIYAEMVRNRGFEAGRAPEGCRIENGHAVNGQGWRQRYQPDAMEGWSVVQQGWGVDGEVAVVANRPLTAANPACLRVEIRNPGPVRFGVANHGYWGMSVREGAVYRLRLHACADGGFAGPLQVSLEKSEGARLAEASLTGLTAEWKRFDAELKASASCTNAALVIAASQPCTFYLDMVSLFPAETFRGRANGMRPDIAQLLADLKPAFLRFPGGCIVEGVTLANRVQWKQTIGDIADRPGHWNLWNYHTTDGVGFHEYLQLCEDLGAEPMYIVNVGMSCQARGMEHADSGDGLQPYIDEALDALEYANGPADSRWGALRAANGHPEPFNIRYVGIGNENSGGVYHAHYRRFFEVLKARHPGLLTISCENHPALGKIEIADEHFYSSAEDLYRLAGRYDAYDRSGPRIMVGEYACMHRGGISAGRSTLRAAVAEAAFMTGIERNADVVTLAAYAPLFANVNDHTWRPDLIYFDSSRAFGSPSYHVQKLFAHHRPDLIHPCQVTFPEPPLPPPWTGGIALGSWESDVSYRNLSVTQGEAVLFEDDFSGETGRWRVVRGQWQARDGVMRQTRHEIDTYTFAGDNAWGDYTLRVEAYKHSGKEGFMVSVRGVNPNNVIRWNLGGWGNTRHVIQQFREGGYSEIGAPLPGAIEAGRWYAIAIEVLGRHVRCFLDGKLVQEGDINQPVRQGVFAVAGRDESRDEIVLKLVNATDAAVEAAVELEGVASPWPAGDAWVLTSGSPDDENSLEQPEKVAPRRVPFACDGSRIRQALPAQSLTVLRVRANAASPRFESPPAGRVRLHGELDRRIRAAVYNNLMQLDWEPDFVQPFRDRNWPEGADSAHKKIAYYVGIGKALNALVRFAEYTRDPQVAALKNRLVNELLQAQLEDGYLGVFKPQHRLTHAWDLHDMVYILQALVEDYRHGGGERSLDAARRMADYVMRSRPAPNFGGERINTERAFIALSAATGERRYLEYVAEGLKLRAWRDPVAGHAYTFLCYCCAQLDLYRLERDPGLLEQSHKVMRQLLGLDSLMVHGTCSLGEGFHTNQYGGGPLGEACATAYLMRMLGMLLQIEGQPIYGDVMERSLYNALPAAQSPDGRLLRYFVPLEGARHYFYLDGYCCPGNWRRIVSELPEMVYYAGRDGVLVNLYTASEAELTLAGGATVRLRQETDYPNSGRVALHVAPDEPAQFALRLRIPRWCRGPRVAVNGAAVPGAKAGELLVLDRRWKAGDTVSCDFPMEIRLVRGRKLQEGRAAVMRGPVLFCLNPARQVAANPALRGLGPDGERRIALLLKLAEARARLAAARGGPVPVADLVCGGPGLGLDPRNGRITAVSGGRLACEPNRPCPAESPFVNCVVVPNPAPGRSGAVPVSTTGLAAADVPRTTGETWDMIRAGAAARQATSTAGGVDYSCAPHTSLAMHGNKAITFDLAHARALTGWKQFTFRAAACYAGELEPRAGVSAYVDGRTVVPRTMLARDPLPVEIPLREGDRFLTLMVSDSNQDISYGQLASPDPLGYDAVFFGDPQLAPPSAPAPAGEARLQNLAQEEAALAAELAALGPAPAPADPDALLREVVLDAASLRGPLADTALRPDGQRLSARAWSPGRDRALPPDLSLELTEYPDPGGEATYFRVSDAAACTDDELAAPAPQP